MIEQRSEMTAREREEYEQSKEMFEKQSEHAVRIKELELEAVRLESKATVWFRIPVLIIKLPVFLILGLGYIVHAIRKTEPSERFWNFLK